MAGAQVAVSALPAVTVLATADILPFVRSGVTDKITAGNFRTQMFAFAAADPLNCGVLTATGNSTITGTLSGVTTFTATSIVLAGTVTGVTTVTASGFATLGGVQINAATAQVIFANGGGVPRVYFSSTGNDVVSMLDSGGTLSNSSFIAGKLSGTLQTAAQPNVTSLGIISALNTTQLLFTTAVGKINPGATSLSLRNNADSVDNLLITDAGNATLRGTFTFATAASKIIPGATSLSLRNNADSNDNVLVSDLGVVTVRAGLTATQITGTGFIVGSNQVVGARVTGYAPMTGTPDKSTAYATSTVTTAQLAGRMMQLQADLTTHGVIGA